jgi:hypothetical protein
LIKYYLEQKQNCVFGQNVEFPDSGKTAGPAPPGASPAVIIRSIAIIRIGGIQLGEELFQLPKPQKRRKP